MIELKSPMWFVFGFSRVRPPIAASIVVSPSKYSSTSAKWSIERIDRFDEKMSMRVVAAHRRRVDAQARVVRPRVGRELDGAVGVAVDVAREAGHALGRLGGDAVVRDVEPGRLERRDQQAQPVDLLRA